MNVTREDPTESQIMQWFDTLNNWGRWGAEDERGTLNLITPAKRRHAAALVRDGVTVSCAHTITYDVASDVPIPPRHFMTLFPDPEPGSYGQQGGSVDEFLYGPHGLTITHLDTPAHSLWRSDPNRPSTTYNGHVAAGKITSRGAMICSVEVAGDGIVSRGVLLDIAGLRGVEWLAPGTAIYPEDLDAAEKAQGVRVESGDVLFVRTGHPAYRAKNGPPPDGSFSGPQAACLPWLRERDVAVLSFDTVNEVGPNQYPKIGFPIHGVGIGGLGLWLIDNGNYEQLVAECRRLNRWDFFVAVGVLKWQNATGTAVNPVAVF
jgi:kynurenine formamidase